MNRRSELFENQMKNMKSIPKDNSDKRDNKISIIINQITIFSNNLESYDRNNISLATSCTNICATLFAIAVTVLGYIKHNNYDNNIVYTILMIVIGLVPCDITLFLYNFAMNTRRTAVYRGYLCFLEQRLNEETGVADSFYNNMIDPEIFRKYKVNKFGPLPMCIFIIIFYIVSAIMGFSCLNMMNGTYRIGVELVYILVLLASGMPCICYLSGLITNENAVIETLEMCYSIQHDNRR